MRKIEGVRRKRGKWQAYVDVVIDGHHRQKTQTFPPHTPFAAMTAWRTKTQQKYEKPAACPPGTFGALVATYLESVQSMPTYAQRAAHLALWVRELGARRPVDSIDPHELNRMMDRWARTPTNQRDPDQPGRRGRPSAPTGVSAATIKKRRASLRAMFNAVNHSKHGFNPARDSHCPLVREYDDARGIPLAEAQRILDAMPPWAWIRKGIKVPARNRPRAAVMLWTGFPPSVIGTITRPDLALEAPTPYVRVDRKKGQGIEERIIHLCPQAVQAFRDLIAAKGLGPFEPGPLNVSVKRAARAADVAVPRNFVAYDLRHSFGSALYAETRDLAAVGRALLHATNSTMARRYTQAAHAEVDAAAAAAMGRTYAGVLPQSARGPKSGQDRGQDSVPEVAFSGGLRRHLAGGDGDAAE